jgi:uncharacterized membrane protein YgcG
MNQINVNPGREPVDVVDTSGDRTAAAGINLITVLIVLAVLAVIAWYLFTGPLRIGGTSSSQTNINVNPAPTTVNVNPPSQPNIPAPGGNTGNTGSSSSSTSGGSTSGGASGSTSGSTTNP